MDSLNLVDEVYFCDIFGFVCEKIGNLMIVDLVYKIKGNYIIKEEYIEEFLKYLEVVILFMGVGDV